MKKKGIGNAYKPNDGQDDDFLFARQLIVTAKGRQVVRRGMWCNGKNKLWGLRSTQSHDTDPATREAKGKRYSLGFDNGNVRELIEHARGVAK